MTIENAVKPRGTLQMLLEPVYGDTLTFKWVEPGIKQRFTDKIEIAKNFNLSSIPYLDWITFCVYHFFPPSTSQSGEQTQDLPFDLSSLE